jgi:putative PIN family toxin of toxin-antitoxin system
MRIVLDTNVIVSALLSPQGIPNQIFHYWELLYFDLLVSEKSMGELARVLRYPKIRRRLNSSTEELAQFVLSLQEKSIWVTHQETVTAVMEDSSDNIYLEIAIAGRAHYVVSGDQHLLRLQGYQGVAIITPAEFLAHLLSSTQDMPK